MPYWTYSRQPGELVHPVWTDASPRNEVYYINRDMVSVTRVSTAGHPMHIIIPLSEGHIIFNANSGDWVPFEDCPAFMRKLLEQVAEENRALE